MKKTILALSAAFLLFGATSCKKDDDNDCAETLEAMAGTYKITAYTLNGVNAMDFISECEKNAMLTLNANGTLVYDETGACTDDATGTWAVTGTNITVTVDGFDFYTGVVNNRCSSLTITDTFSGGGTTATEVVTLTKQ